MPTGFLSESMKQTVRPCWFFVRTGQKSAVAGSANSARPVICGLRSSGGFQAGGPAGTSAHSPPVTGSSAGAGLASAFSCSLAG